MERDTVSLRAKKEKLEARVKQMVEKHLEKDKKEDEDRGGRANQERYLDGGQDYHYVEPGLDGAKENMRVILFFYSCSAFLMILSF